jgi:hypothetical protein
MDLMAIMKNKMQNLPCVRGRGARRAFNAMDQSQ